MLRRKGFTLIEAIIAILISGILSAIAVLTLPNTAGMSLDMAARRVQSDIRYIQSLAVSTQRWTGITFSAASDNYALYSDGLDDGVSDPSGWAIISDPLTRGNYIIQLNSGEFAGIDLNTVYFNGDDNSLVFDRWGNPYSYTGSGAPVALNNPAGVRLTSASGTIDLVVERGTGRVYTQ